jgi:hypothetical protein
LDAICAVLPVTRPDPTTVELLKKIVVMYKAIQEQPKEIVSFLLVSQVNFKEKDVGEVFFFLAKNRSVYNSLPEVKQDVMRRWLFPLLFEQATEVEIHEKIVQLFGTNNREEAFINEYMWLVEKKLGTWKRGSIDPHFLSLLMYYLDGVEDRIEPFFRDGFAKTVFVKFGDNDFNMIERKLVFLKHLSDTGKKRWKAIKKQVHYANQGLVSKAYHFVQKIFGGKES